MFEGRHSGRDAAIEALKSRLVNTFDVSKRQCVKGLLVLALLSQEVVEGFFHIILTVELGGATFDHFKTALECMSQPDDFAVRSDGVGVVHAGELVSAATDYAFSARSVEIAISTREDHRGRGLAACAAAARILRCLSRGVTPYWHASNPVSIRLAKRLGFVPDGEVEIRYLERPGS